VQQRKMRVDEAFALPVFSARVAASNGTLAIDVQSVRTLSALRKTDDDLCWSRDLLDRYLAEIAEEILRLAQSQTAPPSLSVK
jgi:hypothetical protein